MTVAFLTHPIGERDAEWGVARGNNLANAMAWFRLIVDATRWSMCYPEMTYIAAVDDVFHQPARLAASIEILERCDVLVMAGGFNSPHMRLQFAHARRRKLPVLDLLDMGASPLWIDRDEIGSEIRRRAAELGL